MLEEIMIVTTDRQGNELWILTYQERRHVVSHEIL